MDLVIKQASGATSQLYQDSLQIRKTVFVDEQQVPLALEIDQYDETALNYVGYLDQQAVVTCRIIVEADGGWHVQRVATLHEYRHHNYAKTLLSHVIVAAQDKQVPYLILDAQLTAVGFYEKLKFHATARPTFLDANIRHQEMRLDLNN
ncbi:GNAT family N-acetyltransferase [Lapidilactobacillus wuchangensis]|uniref:GNAT family N-acetyltransferase n=1 Tax=Lapidilactobacillus wuchangensis TaxID=2486001 RepID=UPI001CDB4B97|nr:GNAT family N-acetyltransferase [Lapidilactobacillus wuchangensis]